MNRKWLDCAKHLIFLFLLSKFVLFSCHLVSMLPPFPTKEKGNKSCWRWRLSPAPIIPTPCICHFDIILFKPFFTAVLETLWLFFPRMTMSKSIWSVYLSSSLWFIHFLEIVVIYFPSIHFKERSTLVNFLKLLLLQVDNPTAAFSNFPDMSNTPKLWRLFILSQLLSCATVPTSARLHWKIMAQVFQIPQCQNIKKTFSTFNLFF